MKEKQITNIPINIRKRKKETLTFLPNRKQIKE